MMQGGWGRTSMRDSFARRAPIEPIKGRPKVIAHSTFWYMTESGKEVIRYHLTDVVVKDGNSHVLNSGGWETKTTLDRLNRYNPTRVFSHKGIWYVGHQDDRCPVQVYRKFFDGIRIPEDVFDE